MPLPASDPNKPNPAPATPAPPQQFDLLAFWIQYQRLIIRLVIVALIAVAGWGAWLFMDYRKRASSEEALANAKTAADYRKAADEWAGTPAAGTATVRLAEELRKEGKAAEAAQALRDFLAKYPAHPMRAPAAHALAASLETAGKYEEALTAYQQFGAQNGRSAFAPLAVIGQARVLIALNRTEEAQKALESVEQKFPGNPFVDDARTLLDDIKNAAGRKTGGSPRPTPAPTPTPVPAPALNLQGGTPSPLQPGSPAPAPSISITPAPATPAPVVPSPAAPATPPVPDAPK
jgi:tetratricopeptide (TPR) repeat protein